MELMEKGIFIILVCTKSDLLHNETRSLHQALTLMLLLKPVKIKVEQAGLNSQVL